MENLELAGVKEALVRRALTHSSYVTGSDRAGTGPHNERLEYLGDAVLELVVSEYLFRKHPDMPEGKLTRLRANLVRESSLVRVAEDLGLPPYMAMRKDTDAVPSMVADALEALVGAVFLSQGYQGAREAVYRWFAPVFSELEKGEAFPDYKSLMQEYAQEKYNLPPRYRIVEEEGPPHDRTFTAEFILGDKVWASGSGKRKKDAEQEAARKAYERILGQKPGSGPKC